MNYLNSFVINYVIIFLLLIKIFFFFLILLLILKLNALSLKIMHNIENLDYYFNNI